MLTNEVVEQILKIPHWHRYLIVVIDEAHFNEKFDLLVDVVEEAFGFNLVEHLDRVVRNAIDNFSVKAYRSAVVFSYFLNAVRFLFFKNKHILPRVDFLAEKNRSYHAKFLSFYYLVQKYYNPTKFEVHLYKLFPYRFVNAHKYMFNRYLDTSFYYSFMDVSGEKLNDKSFSAMLGIIVDFEV